MRHVGTARVHVALPRGLACHVASTRAPRPFFLIPLFIFLLKIENKIIENSEKYRKIPKNCKNHIF